MSQMLNLNVDLSKHLIINFLSKLSIERRDSGTLTADCIASQHVEPLLCHSTASALCGKGVCFSARKHPGRIPTKTFD